MKFYLGPQVFDYAEEPLYASYLAVKMIYLYFFYFAKK